MAHSGKDHASLPKPIVGHGHPLDPNRGQLLSEDDERRVDEKGRPIASGLLWGNSHTGAYICVAVCKDGDWGASKTCIGHTATEKYLDGRRIHVFCSVGKPKITVPYFGACLELPSDLGRDDTKQQYVTEWVAATAAESIVKAGCRTLVGDPILQGQIAQWVAMSANEAINKLGL